VCRPQALLKSSGTPPALLKRNGTLRASWPSCGALKIGDGGGQDRLSDFMARDSLI